jgi:hypothetical protein
MKRNALFQRPHTVIQASRSLQAVRLSAKQAAIFRLREPPRRL